MKFISSTGGAENFLCQRFDRLCSKHVLPIFVRASPDEVKYLTSTVFNIQQYLTSPDEDR